MCYFYHSFAEPFDKLELNIGLVQGNVLYDIFQEFQTLPELDQDTALLYENFNKITLNSFDKSDINFQTKQQSSYSSSIKNAVYDLIKYYTEGYTIILTADTKIHLDRLKDIISKLLQESGLKDDLISDYKDSFFESVILSERSYSNGFIWQDY